MAKRPNVLILITDQHRPDHTGFGGNGVLRTPHLDRLAARATVFDRAYVANPICMPNRSTIFTGRMPSVHGTRYNGIPLAMGANTFARVLRAAGYATSYFGKCHLQNMGVAKGIADAIFAKTPKVDAESPAWPADWDRWEDEERHRRERVAIPADYYGFDHVDLTVDHSDQCSGHYYQWLLEQGADPKKLQGPENALPFDSSIDQIWRTATPEELYPTRYVTMRAVEHLDQLARKARESEAPFLMVASYPDPHHPFTPPGRYFDRYDPADVGLPATFGDAHRASMPHIRRMTEQRGKQPFVMAPFAPTERQLRQMAAAEYGMIAMIDDGIGEILGALERGGLAGDTIVVFTSDHGDMFGDHGLMLKAAMHYEGCVRVPLLIAVPGRAPARTGSLVGSIDVAQTLLALTGGEPFYGMQARSLVPVLDDPGATVRDEILIEEDEMFDIAGVGRPLRMRTLITNEGRITLYDGTPHGELFDHRVDRAELENRFADPGAAAWRAEMTERLARAVISVAEESPRPRYMA